MVKLWSETGFLPFMERKDKILNKSVTFWWVIRYKE